MPLPYIFAAATTVTTPQLDANFAAVGALGIIPTGVSGTNSLTMTAVFPNTPTIAAYADYQVFSFTAAGNNTGATVARYQGLPLLNVYKDTTAGPALLTGGEIFTSNYCTLTYDNSLNLGAGGFHLQTTPAVGSGAFLPLGGGTLTGGLTGTSAAFSGNVRGGTLQVTSAGTAVTRLISAAASLTWSVVAAGGSQDQTIAVVGASIGDIVSVGRPASLVPGVLYDARVSATGVVSVRATNATSATVTPTGGSYRVAVEGFT